MGAMGLCGEAGEACDLIKKHIFNGHKLDRLKLSSELGDVLWYLAVTADALGIDLAWIAEQNLAKLAARYPNGYSDEASIERADANG
jgi:NTP pyrophosphatase (non-canonical NTP hydrolase)